MTPVHLTQLSYANTGPAQQLAADMLSPTGGGLTLWPRVGGLNCPSDKSRSYFYGINIGGSAEDRSEVTECISGYQEPVLGSAPGPVGRCRACWLH